MPPTGPIAKQPRKAIVFTHFGGLKYTAAFSPNIDVIEQQYRAILERYCRSYERDGNPGLVYVYVDWAFRKIVADIKQRTGQATTDAIFDKSKGTFFVDSHILADEQKLFDVLQRQEDEIKAEMQTSANIPGPRFEYIGIVKLVNLLNCIIEIDPGLIDYLSGSLGQPTYDTPKFVEAVIRLARSAVAALATNPIVRIDEDVSPSDSFYSELLSHYEKNEAMRGFFFWL
jgi:hypothetical protein